MEDTARVGVYVFHTAFQKQYRLICALQNLISEIGIVSKERNRWASKLW